MVHTEIGLRPTRIKKQSIILLFLLLTAFCSLASDGQDSGGSSDPRITAVDHSSHTVIINDSAFKMLIGLDVYIYDGKTRKKKKVNRYALKKDDLVYFTAETRNRQRYLSEITIFR
ncbi:hypothetical protein IMCC1989_2498 [gamma proteobacterium IMCC1989]|nr:hypothetical protein IMCC1989_2498 [gamma proteobacterium IMCC1989]